MDNFLLSLVKQNKHAAFNELHNGGEPLKFDNFCCGNPLNDFNFKDIDFTNSQFPNIENCVFENCNLSRCDFKDVQNCTFINCTFDFANFQSLLFLHNIFALCDFTNVSFVETINFAVNCFEKCKNVYFYSSDHFIFAVEDCFQNFLIYFENKCYDFEIFEKKFTTELSKEIAFLTAIYENL